MKRQPCVVAAEVNNWRPSRILLLYAWLRTRLRWEIGLPTSGDVRIDPAAIAALHLQHADELRYFILGVVRDPELTSEVLQTAFAKAVELGHTVQQGSLKAWLFRVAYNEALALRRRRAIGEKVTQKLRRNWLAVLPQGETPEARAARQEAAEAVRKALQELPQEQQQVVRMRMYQQKRFAEIAEELELPLGTVLSRMQLALKKLRQRLKAHDERERTEDEHTHDEFER